MFSIIIPAHNSSKTIGRCLDSILNQDIDDFEVLLTENGSTDDTLSICNEYANKDSRIKVFSIGKCNGPSKARNNGLEHATGEYICFIDSDDYVEKNYLSSLKEEFDKGADAVFISANVVDRDGKNIGNKIPKITACEREEIVEELLHQDHFGYTCIKSIRSNLIKNSRFDESVDLFEDEIFTCEVMKNCKKIGIVKEPIYVYIVGDDSSLTNKTQRDFPRKRELVYVAWRQLTPDFSNRDRIVEYIANKSISLCKYYFFEREIDEREFIDALASTEFIHAGTVDATFVELVLEKNYKKLRQLKNREKQKQKIAKLFGR